MTDRRTAAGLLLLDVLITIAVFKLVGLLRGVPGGVTLIGPLWAPVLMLVLALHLIDGYDARTDLLSVDYASQHVIALLGAMTGTLVLTYVFIPHGYELQSSRLVIALSYVALIPVTLAYRRAAYLRALGRRGERCLVFYGDAAAGEAFAAECSQMRGSQRVVLAAPLGTPVGPAPSAGSVAGPRTLDQVLDDIEQGRLAAEAIVLRESARELTPQHASRLMQLYFSGVPTYPLELFHEVYWRKIPLYRLNQTWLFQEGFRAAREPFFDRLKRASDVVLSMVGLLFSFPIIVLAALAIWLEDRGPPLFRQTRIGKNNRRFEVLKLRTMRPAAGSAPLELYTRPADARITRIGRFLRSTRIDEVPQLWNVLRGEMSLIGPRAEWERLVEKYEREIPCYHFRHLVRPGITGWAQVNYPYGASTEDTVRKLEYDLYYIRHFSFQLDAAIVLKTIHTMLFGKGR